MHTPITYSNFPVISSVRDGYSTTDLVTRFTTGNTRRSAGNATSQLANQVDGHTFSAANTSPFVRRRLTADTSAVINNDKSNGDTIAA